MTAEFYEVLLNIRCAELDIVQTEEKSFLRQLDREMRTPISRRIESSQITISILENYQEELAFSAELRQRQRKFYRIDKPIN